MAFLCMLGKSNCDSTTPTPRPQYKARKRLQKKSPQGRDFCKRNYPYKDFDFVKAQSCLTLISEYDEDPTYSKSLIAQQHDERMQHIGSLLEGLPSNFPDGSICDFSRKEFDNSIFRRKRAKNQVFAVGQLEQKEAPKAAQDAAQFLAEQYRAILPSRAITPNITPLVTTSTPKTLAKALRKIKSQKSLRDMVNDQSARHSGDSRALVDSHSGSSPTSPTDNHQDNDELFAVQIHQDLKHQDEERLDSDPEMEDEAGLWICMDLLTSELANAFFRKHPVENEDRASRLQILFMIEACEGVQCRIRRKRHSCRVMGKNEDSMREADEILEHWLQVLYDIYDLTEDLCWSDLTPNGEGLWSS
jgi:hypothetical protein